MLAATDSDSFPPFCFDILISLETCEIFHAKKGNKSLSRNLSPVHKNLSPRQNIIIFVNYIQENVYYSTILSICGYSSRSDRALDARSDDRTVIHFSLNPGYLKVHSHDHQAQSEAASHPANPHLPPSPAAPSIPGSPRRQSSRRCLPQAENESHPGGDGSPLFSRSLLPGGSALYTRPSTPPRG